MRLFLVLTILLGSVAAFAAVAEAKTIHALLVIMDEDPMNFGQYKKNHNRIEKLLKKVDSEGICSLRLTYLGSDESKSQGQPTRNRILEWVTTVRPRLNDVIFIYFCGHGSREPDEPGGKTFFQVTGGNLFRDELVNALQASSAWTCRLKILLTDTCSGKGRSRGEIQTNLAGNYKEDRAYTHLFAQSEGFLHLTSATEGEVSYGDATNGGWFTNGLVSSIHEHADDSKGFVEWQTIFADAKKEVNRFFKQWREDDPKGAQDYIQRPKAYSFPQRVTEPEKWEDKDMVLIPAGSFQMGSDTGFNNEKPVHTVYLDAFYMDTHEVTNAQYKAFVDANPDWQKGGALARNYANADYLKHWQGNTYPKGRDKHPVVWVSWYAAMAYAQWAGKRLPTEAEWEKAARGGLVGMPYPWDARFIDSSKANYGEKRSMKPIRTTPVDSYAPNPYGLYNMVGNVYEWCLDGWEPYAQSSRNNPVVGAGSIREILSDCLRVGTPRVIRGGAWTSQRKGVRVANRAKGDPKNTDLSTGFRCAN